MLRAAELFEDLAGVLEGTGFSFWKGADPCCVACTFERSRKVHDIKVKRPGIITTIMDANTFMALAESIREELAQ
jgi:hypothetical protein